MSLVLNSEFVNIHAISYQNPDDIDITTLNWYKKTSRINRLVYKNFINPHINEQILDECCREISESIHTLEVHLKKYQNQCETLVHASEQRAAINPQFQAKICEGLAEKRIFIEKEIVSSIRNINMKIDESAKLTGKKYAKKMSYLKSNYAATVEKKLNKVNDNVKILWQNFPKYFAASASNNVAAKDDEGQNLFDRSTTYHSFAKIYEEQMLSNLFPWTDLGDNLGLENQNYISFGLMRLR